MTLEQIQKALAQGGDVLIDTRKNRVKREKMISIKHL